MLLRPTKTAPAARSAAAVELSSRAIISAWATTPPVVAFPASSVFTFIDTGTPCSGPTARPCAVIRSARSAASSASSA